MPYTPNNPLVPGDPYSYDLNWIVVKLKEAIALYSPLNDKFNDLYDYVHDYFASSDFKELIDEGLQVMIDDGSLAKIIAPIFSDYQAEIAGILTRIGTQDTNIATLSARMDEFTSLPPGSTAGNAEILDIRVAANGVTYPSAGDAVRAQYNILNAEFEAETDAVGLKKYADLKISNGTTGNPANLTAVNTATYIPVNLGDVAAIQVNRIPTGTDYYSFAYHCYDASLNALQYVDYNRVRNRNQIIAAFPPATKYVRFSILEVLGDASGYQPIRETDFNIGDVIVTVLKDKSAFSILDSLYNQSNEGIYRKITEEDIISGSYSGTGEIVANAARLRTNGFIPVKNGQILSFIPGSNAQELYYAKFDSSKNFINERGWNYNKFWANIDWDGYLICTFRRSDNSNIDPNDYDAETNIFESEFWNNSRPVIKKLKNARHVIGNLITPLTLFHFSDLHEDKAALARLRDYIDNEKTGIDDIICTGDMVANTAAPIASWWDPEILTCIGNHDAASYDSNLGYDWNAISMADKSSYYIAPFEAGWNIVHSANTSYYYKDYAAQKVRLIVLDSQLYVNNPSNPDALAQNSWLATTLSNAITNDLHVIIAIHSPVNNAPIIDCTFSRYARTNMLTLTDSFTSQDIVNAVSAAISNGLKFIGYIVGHNHQDYIYNPAAGQLGYCITCAAVDNENQWYESDQNRSVIEDAYNLITIDTSSTSIRIIRGGGADIDNCMRSRKAICFNYITGTMVSNI